MKKEIKDEYRRVQCNWCNSVFYEDYIVKEEDEEDACPVCGEKGYLMDIQPEEEKPRFETPEEREKRTGEKLDELTPVWVRHVWGDDWCWHLGTYEEEKENNKYFEESGYKCDMVIATEAGPPPDDWRPEETT